MRQVCDGSVICLSARDIPYDKMTADKALVVLAGYELKRT